MIAGMIPRYPNHLLRRCLLGMALASSPALYAGELMPFEVPEEEIQWDKIEIEEFNTAVPDMEPPPAPKDTGPDYPRPVVDAYADLAGTSTSFDSLGYRSSPNGSRVIIGFRLGALSGDRWDFGPEFGYSRIGDAERGAVTVDPARDQDYIFTFTDTFNTDLAALDFGVRSGFRILPRLQVYGRGGMQVYHTRDKVQTTLTFTPKRAGVPARPDDVQRPSSVSDSGFGLFAGGGLSLKLGQVPSVYIEYLLRDTGSVNLDTVSAGLEINF